MTVYLTTDLQTQNSHFLNNAANLMLTPARYLFGGRTVWVVDNRALAADWHESTRSWLTTAGMIALLVPGVILGALARCLSYAIEEVRSALLLAANTHIPLPEPIRQEAAPADIDHLPIESVIDKDIAFFKELLAVPEDKLKAWLESKKTDRSYINPFHGASVLAESKISFEDIGSGLMTELLELFGKAAERLQKIEAAESVIKSTPAAVSASAPAKPKEPKPPSAHLLDMFKKVRPPVLNEKQFADLCKRYNQDSKVVLATIQESERTARLQRLTDLAIFFFLNLRDVQDNKLLEWILAQKASKNYPYPFTLGADCIKQKDFYKKVLGNAAFTDLHENYTEASKRLTKLGLQACLNEKVGLQ